MNIKSRIVLSVITAASMGYLSSAAMAVASFTTVNAPPSGEKNHKQILSQIYGGTWSLAANGRDYSSSNFTAMRLADAGVPTPTSLTTGVSGTDNAWTGPSATQIVAKAKYAADNAVFGYYDDTGTDHSFHTLFNTANLNSSATINMPAAFRWALKDTSTNTIFTSRSSDNPGGVGYANSTYDQLVTYKITNCLTGACEWALFWEDRSRCQSSDRDFNDSVITIMACNVPSPGAAALLGLGGITFVSRRKRK